MTFDWPLALLLLVAVPALAALYVHLDRRKRSQATRFGNPALVAGLLPARPSRRRHLPVAIMLAAIAALVVGVARPHAVLSVPREEATIMLVMDTSFSMSATDVKPNRLKAATAAIEAFMEKIPGSVRVGLVSFSDQAQLILAPTTDRDAARASLAQIRLGRGTAIGAAVVKALTTVRPVAGGASQGQQGQGGAGGGQGQQAIPKVQAGRDAVPAAIVLLSDGAQTGGGPQPAAAAKAALEAGVPISTVALGTGDAVVEVPLPGGLKERVVVAPDREALAALAKAGGGKAYEVTDAAKLEEVYRDLGSRMGTTDADREITAAFAGGGAFLALLAGALSMAWFRRPL